mgnify:CR=1 FL=1
MRTGRASQDESSGARETFKSETSFAWWAPLDWAFELRGWTRARVVSPVSLTIGKCWIAGPATNHATKRAFCWWCLRCWTQFFWSAKRLIRSICQLPVDTNPGHIDTCRGIIPGLCMGSRPLSDLFCLPRHSSPRRSATLKSCPAFNLSLLYQRLDGKVLSRLMSKHPIYPPIVVPRGFDQALNSVKLLRPEYPSSNISQSVPPTIRGGRNFLREKYWRCIPEGTQRAVNAEDPLLAFRKNALLSSSEVAPGTQNGQKIQPICPRSTIVAHAHGTFSQTPRRYDLRGAAITPVVWPDGTLWSELCDSWVCP